jgi:hypothetical protein
MVEITFLDKKGGEKKLPGGDRTGPSGFGPRTGRAAGYCAGYPSPGYMNAYPRFGRGVGFGRGRGRGFGRGFWGQGQGFWRRGYYPEPYYESDQHFPQYQQPSPAEKTKQEKDYLENLIKDLEEELKAIKERLIEITKEKKEAP